VHEGDAASVGSRPGYFVHEPVAGLPAAGQGGVEVGDLVADVMDARPAPGDEFRDGAVGRARLEQFHVGAPEGQRHDGGAVGSVGCGRLDTEDVTIECQRLRDVRHGDADMSDAGLIGQSVLREDDATGDVPDAGNLKGER